MFKVLVTGGAGFIGSHTVDALLEKGAEVVVLDNLSSGKLTNLRLDHPNLTFIEGDILEFPLLKELIQDCQSVLHLAAIASVQYCFSNPIYSFQVNTQGLLHVLEAIKEVNSAICLVYASSAAVYGENPSLPSSDELNLLEPPISPYALQKIHSENYARLYHQLYNIKSIGLRYFNVYGERQAADSPYSGVISKFLAAYLDDRELTVFGDGHQSRDFIHVRDVVAANLLSLEKKEQGIVNIGTGKPQTLLGLIKEIETVGKREAKLTFVAPKVGDIQHSYASISKAKRILDFEANIALNRGIRQLMAKTV